MTAATQTVHPCKHGSPARHVFVVDQARVTDLDPYGDIVGPVGVETVDTMASIRDEYAAERPGERGRFVLAFVHADRCRTEQA